MDRSSFALSCGVVMGAISRPDTVTDLRQYAEMTDEEIAQLKKLMSKVGSMFYNPKYRSNDEGK